MALSIALALAGIATTALGITHYLRRSVQPTNDPNTGIGFVSRTSLLALTGGSIVQASLLLALWFEVQFIEFNSTIVQSIVISAAQATVSILNVQLWLHYKNKVQQ